MFGHGNQKDKLWQRSVIRHFLRTPTTIGRHVPFVTEFVDGIRRLRPQTAVENYYPAIISKKDWDRAQAKRAEWGERYHLNVPERGRANVLAHLSRCPFCDRNMILLCAGKPGWRYLMCRRAHHGAGCSDRWVRFSPIEEVFTSGVAQVIATCPEPAVTKEVRDHMLDHIRRRLRGLRSQRASMIAEHQQLRQSSRAVLEPRRAVEAEIAKLVDDRERLREDRPRWLDLTLQNRLERLRDVATAPVLDKLELHTLLRALFTKVIIDWQRDRVVLHWKHGGESIVTVCMKPHRQVCNPRRADRPRFRPGEMAPRLPAAAL